MNTAQHSVHPTGGSLRVFEHFSWLGVGSVKVALSRPTHQRVTQAVSPLTPRKFLEIYSQKSFVRIGKSKSIKKGFEQNDMNEEYNIISVDKPDDSVWNVVGWGIHNYNIQLAGDPQSQQLCFVLRAPNQEIVGGLIGKTYWDWFYIDLLFVKEELRGCGYGHRLLEMAENEARKRGAKHVYLDTFSFQAPDFYNQHGYRVFGELKDFPPGHQRCFFTKQL